MPGGSIGTAANYLGVCMAVEAGGGAGVFIGFATRSHGWTHLNQSSTLHFEQIQIHIPDHYTPCFTQHPTTAHISLQKYFGCLTLSKARRGPIDESATSRLVLPSHEAGAAVVSGKTAHLNHACMTTGSRRAPRTQITGDRWPCLTCRMWMRGWISTSQTRWLFGEKQTDDSNPCAHASSCRCGSK